jgi:hypothetical protein
MGMTEQKDYFLRQRQIAEDVDEPMSARINAWCEWGKMARNSHDAAAALTAIQELIRKGG